MCRLAGRTRATVATIGSSPVRSQHQICELPQKNEPDCQMSGTFFQNAQLHNRLTRYFWQYSSQQGVQVTIDTTESENATGGLCVSDNTTTPVLSQDVEGDAHFTLGVPPYRHINVTRKNGNNAMIFSHGVWISDRSLSRNRVFTILQQQLF